MELSEKTGPWFMVVAVSVFLVGCFTILYGAWKGIKALLVLLHAA